MTFKEKTNAVLRRATGYSLTKETPEERERAITAAASEAAQRARRQTLANERERQRQQAEQRKALADERAAQREQERQQRREERERAKEAERAERRAAGADLPHHFDDDKRSTVLQVRDWTMTRTGKLDSLIEATRYVVRHRVPGDVVECGVWRGGSMQAMALTLLSRGDTSRELHLFDTFEGMSEPTEEDGRTRDGVFTSAAELLDTHEKGTLMWADAGLDLVKEGMARTNYPADKIHYHVGKVEDTTPQEAPEQIAILRLDTDWYASTKHELEHLYPRLVPGGILILDDYTTWDGAKKAIDEWLEETGLQIFMQPIGGGLVAVKPLA